MQLRERACKISTMYFSVNFLCTFVGAVLHVPVMPITWQFASDAGAQYWRLVHEDKQHFVHAAENHNLSTSLTCVSLWRYLRSFLAASCEPSDAYSQSSVSSSRYDPSLVTVVRTGTLLGSSLPALSSSCFRVSLPCGRSHKWSAMRRTS